MEPLGDWTDVAPWKSARVVLLAEYAGGDWRSEHTVTGKRDLLTDPNVRGLIAGWGGEWRTTARRFQPGDVEKVRERLG